MSFTCVGGIHIRHMCYFAPAYAYLCIKLLIERKGPLYHAVVVLAAMSILIAAVIMNTMHL